MAKDAGAYITRARPHRYQTPPGSCSSDESDASRPYKSTSAPPPPRFPKPPEISARRGRPSVSFLREPPCSPAAMAMAAAAPAPIALPPALAGWWEHVNGSPAWQDGIFWALGILYGLVAASSFIQVARIQHRVPEYGWTTQKVFQFLNFVVNGARCSIFAFRRQVQLVNPEIFQHVILDLPGLAFFTTYAMLALFWAEISYQARGLDTDGLRSGFYTINAVIYAIQVLVWVLLWLNPNPSMLILSKLFIAGLSFSAALGFLLYGGRLFLMLKRFPIESKGRQQKLSEVGKVAAICSCCFLARCVMMCFDAFDKEADLDVLYHPILNFFYYLLVEILPSALVLFILRRIPSKLRLSHYHPLSSG